MSHSGKKPGRSARELPEEIETEPDGWDRFTKAVKRMAPLKPKRAKTKPRKSEKSV